MRATIELADKAAMAAELARLVATSVIQRRAGLVPALSAVPTIRYRREPPGRERWQTAAETNRFGYGDCEDLAIWLASDFCVAGHPACVVIKDVAPGKMHALVSVRLPTRRGLRAVIVDPSRARGMGRRS